MGTVLWATERLCEPQTAMVVLCYWSIRLFIANPCVEHEYTMHTKTMAGFTMVLSVAQSTAVNREMNTKLNIFTPSVRVNQSSLRPENYLSNLLYHIYFTLAQTCRVGLSWTPFASEIFQKQVSI